MAEQRLVLGIDGGGSTVRVVTVTPDLTVRGEGEGPTANPSVVGHDTATRTIQAAMRAALANAHAAPDQVAAVGIGVAGAAAHHSADWLRAVVLGVTPGARVTPSSDFEIALVGALGERCGVLVLAGTGSLAYGVNAVGESALVGGWGYLLDDSGGGYWLGIRGLEAVARDGDGRGPRTALTGVLLDALGLRQPLDLVPWLYHSGASRTRDVAALAPLVLDAADSDAVAGRIVAQGADELALAARTVIHRLALHAPGIAFAGGLLSRPNPLSTRLCAALKLEALPMPRHTPAIGAALLALLLLEP